MPERSLNTRQVASMLASTSCGIGFLLGTGELALYQGMVGCVYALASALGLAILAVCSSALWNAGRSIWGLFGQLYGPSVSHSAALLSLIWMTGALGAQIRGGSAILALSGLPETVALPLIASILIGLSLVRLSWLSAGLAICMLGCGTMLVSALLETGGIGVWLHAPMLFADAMRQTSLGRVGITVTSVVAMVICGADYQQFVIAADKPSAARTGCLVAAGFVFIIGFLPASAVIAARSFWHLNEVSDPAEVVPILLMRSLSDSMASNVVIALLSAATLGAGCAILRAMSEVVAAIGPQSVRRPISSRILPVVLSLLVAARGQSLVDMMVDLNMVYLAAVGPLLVLRLLRLRVCDIAANTSMAAGCGIALSCYLLRWMGVISLPSGATTLLSLLIALVLAIARHNHTVSPYRDSEHPKRSLWLTLMSQRRFLLPYQVPQGTTEPDSVERDTSRFR
ncbi:SLC5/6 family protein [Paraburkholderia oxyphila]|uniref:hypothetical protein n=1 Tax=Paraburkholderia oxyphila TaxID=614212 RepID=UPI0006940231|nr:hypothetical protein [Paraburkholderia oxyphila]